MMQSSSDYISDIIEEIALEGLDGITLQALWLRLSERPGFALKPIDENVKRFVWKVISRLSNVEFYNLPKERKDLIIFRRTEFIGSCGNFYEPVNMPVCLYPHAPVEADGIMGSCSTYSTRENVTSPVRLEDYDTVISRGNFLAIVADQNTRYRALCSRDFNPLTELAVIPYCILERVGRSRYDGEVTQGKRGLQLVTEDPKMLYYFRKLLVKSKLVLKQVFFMKVSKLTSTGSLLHLPKFYSEIKSRQDVDAIKVIQFLEKAPLKCMPLKTIKSKLNIELKKIIMKYPKNFKTATVPYRVLNPTSKPSDWKLKSSGEEKSVRVLKLISSSIRKDDDEDEDEDDEEGLLDESQRRMDRCLMRQAYTIVEKAGPRGIKQTALGSLLAIPSLQSRSICKHLVKRKLVKTTLLDVGRQRITYYYCAKFDSSKISLTSEIKEEENKLLQAITVNSSIGNDSVKAINSSQEVDNHPETSSSQEKIDKTEIISDVEDEEVNDTPQENIQAEIIIRPGDVKKSIRGELKALKRKKNNPNVITARMLKRANIIVQSVNMHKVIQDTQKVQRIVSEIEEAEGSKQTVDRKTIQRLLDKLESDGLLKTITVNLRGYGKVKSMVFICHPSVNETHSEIQSAIEQAKMKLPIVSAHHIKKNQKKIQDSKKSKPTTFKYDNKAGQRYGYKPKCVRMRVLHSYMYYLIYGYDGDPNLDQSCKKDLVRKMELPESLVDEMSFLYRTEVDWKMFLPPLPKHAEYKSGWCLLSDVLLRLPLCLFVSIVNVPYVIPGLMDYINHPIKRFFLVKELEPEILHHLTLMRKYIFVVSEIVARLGFIGLIQMGPQKLKEKDQVFIYLNRNAILYNTTTSEVGYNHISKDKIYECVKYHFNSVDDVEQYWYDLWNFARNTNLGNRNSMTGQPVVVESVNTKKELLAAIQVKTVDEASACDVGYLPGDSLGAGGLDSDMFVHLKRNWYWTGKKIEEAADEKSILYPPIIKTPSKSSTHKEGTSEKSTSHSSSGKSIKLKHKDHKVEKQVIQKEGNSEALTNEANKVKITRQTLPNGWKSRAVSKKKTRILRQRKSKFPRKPYYDQKDKDALSRMVKLRVDWSPVEDNLLLICKVASLYMSPSKRRHVAKNFCAVREVLHTHYPAISINKTSRACQRRMHYMMKNDFTAQSVYMCLEEVKQDPEVHAQFDRAVEKLDALLKAQGEGPKGFQQEYDKIFINLVTILFKKLKTITNPHKSFFDITLPDTVAEFEKIYNPFIPIPLNSKNGTFNEIQKTIDISASVINTVIHSSLCCTAEKTLYSNQLFYIYQQYSDKLLRHVMAKCRSMQIVSCSKRYKRWKSMGYDCLPLASSPYQLSITYVHILQSKYQFNIFSECYHGLKSILDGSITHSKKKSEIKKIEEKQPNKVTVKVEVTSGGQCANVVELFTSDVIEMNVEFPDQLIVLDPRLSETEESYQLIMKRFKEMLTIIKDSRKKDSKALLSEDEEEEEDMRDDQNSDKDTYFEQFNLKNKTGVANTASRLSLYLMRDEPNEQLDKSLQHAHDFFVLNPCKVTVEVDRNRAEEVISFKDLKTQVIADIKKFATFPCDKKENDEIIDSLDLKRKLKSLVMSLLNFLESKCEFGATFDELKEQFDDDDGDLGFALTTLVDNQFILKTGVVTPRFVHNKFTHSWLVKSFYLYRLVRENLGSETTNASYAISFTDKEPSGKRKIVNKNSPKESSEDTPRKKSKLDISEEDYRVNNSESFVSPKSVVKAKRNDDTLISAKDESPYPLKKKIKIDENLSESISPVPLIADNESIDKEMFDVSDKAPTGKDSKSFSNEDSPQPSTSQERCVEKETKSRFVVKSTHRKWVPVPTENLKKFNNFDTSKAKNILVNVQPWIKIDGTLNRRVLDRLLGSVLGHCFTCPGMYVSKVQERFTPALQPVHTYELLEILQQIKCVKLLEIKKSWKCSLFSKRVPITPGPATGLGCLTNVIVEPDPLAVSRLGYFIGDKNYSIDYLAQLSYKNREGAIA